MKKIIYLSAMLSLLLGLQHATANHLFGGEIKYRFVSESAGVQTYEVSLIFFADCSANIPGSNAYHVLPISAPTVRLFKGDEVISTNFLGYDASISDVEITQICEDEISNSTCTNVNNPIPGVKRFVYRKNIEVPGISDNWRFLFAGNMGNSSAGRSTIIQNADVMNGASLMALVATLDNTIGPNSSPEFISAPNPFFCINKKQSYSLGATDADNDQLKYALIPGKQPGDTLGSVEDIEYIPPFTATMPLASPLSEFGFSESTGYLYFLPDQLKNCVVVNEIEEYRNGRKVGTSMREMTFIVLNNCLNDLPLANFDHVTNADVSIENMNPVLTVCYGFSGTISFDVSASDPNGDNITISGDALPANAVFTLSNNNSPAPSFHFEWDVTGLPPGDHIFYVSFTDDGCPLSAVTTQTYTIRVAPYDGIFDYGMEGPCLGMSNGKAWVKPAGADHQNYEYTWTDASGTVLQSGHSTIGDTLSGLPLGMYKVQIVTEDGCKKDIFINIDKNAVPPTVKLPGDTTLCNDLVLTLSAEVDKNAAYRWNTGATGCCIDIAAPGTYTLTVSNACGSAQDSVTVNYVKCNFCVFVPNAFSPNGDGINDEFKVRETCTLTKYTIKIFNRWGNLVFNANALNKAWDGTYKGLPAEVGDYGYIIEATAADQAKGSIVLKGFITLIR